jgi:hypothetical protein
MATLFANLANNESAPDSYTPVNVQFVDANGKPVAVGGGSGEQIKSVKALKINAGGTPTATLADGVLTLGLVTGDKGATGTNGADGKSVKSLALKVDGAGKVTGGTMTLSDNSTSAVTITTA